MPVIDHNGGPLPWGSPDPTLRCAKKAILFHVTPFGYTQVFMLRDTVADTGYHRAS
jgi:hypothetical protein